MMERLEDPVVNAYGGATLERKTFIKDDYLKRDDRVRKLNV